MVDAGEQLSVTLKREFGEEALNSIEVSDGKKEDIKTHVDNLFMNGTEVIRYYCMILYMYQIDTDSIKYANIIFGVISFSEGQNNIY